MDYFHHKHAGGKSNDGGSNEKTTLQTQQSLLR